MKKIFFLFFMIILLQILDNTLVNNFAIFGYKPSLLFVFIVCYSIICGKQEAFFIAIVAGFFQDVFYLNSIGINMMTNLLSCLFAAQIGENLFIDKKLIPTIIIFISSLTKQLLIVFLLYINRYNMPFQFGFFASIYNFIIGYFIYTLTLKITRSSFMVKNWRF